MGPLTGRLRKAVVSMPGGCVIGDRPVDLHLKGLEYLGAKVQMDGGNIHIEAKKPLKGCTMNLLGKFGSTVLGTDNVLMAAVLTKGTTIIEGAAAEPEVEDLANFLIKMGAKIEGAGTTRIVVEGVKELHGAEHTVIPDRIEAGTFLVAGAIFGDGVMVKRVVPAHLKNVTDTLLASGYEVTSTKDSVTIMPGSGAPKGFHLTTRVYPGFPTDMQAQFCALACLIPGLSSIKETIFPQRFMHVSELKRMAPTSSSMATPPASRASKPSVVPQSWPVICAPPPPSCWPASPPKAPLRSTASITLIVAMSTWMKS